MRKRLGELLNGEWMLRFGPNGGSVVFWRSLQISLSFFLLAVGLDSYLKPNREFGFSFSELAIAGQLHLTWFGALFGATYAALYTRFASQWLYLAGLYNQLMSAECSEPRSELTGARRHRRMLWWMAFMEDTVDMHLADKESYATAIAMLMAEAEVAAEVHAQSGEDVVRLGTLPAKLARALGQKLFAELSTPIVAGVTSPRAYASLPNASGVARTFPV